MHALVGGHGRGRLGVGLVVAAGLGPLDQPEHDQGTEPAGQPAQQSAAPPRLGAGPLGRVELGCPVGGVAFLGPGQGEQDVPVLPGALGGQGPVDGGGVLLLRQAPPISAVTPSDRGHHSSSTQASPVQRLGS
jgi:hypothetical protein